MNEIHFTKKDFKLEWYSGTGGGGQHRNKHQNCCRITHLETGFVERGTSHRERPANQKEAFTKLANRIIAFYDKEETKEINKETIRTYHAVRNVVHDKASGLKESYQDVVIKGNIGNMVDARKKTMES